MKKNYLKLLPLFLTFPMLMANAPAPDIRPEGYKDFSISYANKKEYDGEEFYYYSFNFVNKGSGYIETINIANNKDYSDANYLSLYIRNFFSDSLFLDTLLPPNFEGEVKGGSKRSVDDIGKIKATVYAYDNFANEVTVNGTKQVKYKSMYDGNYVYTIDLSFDGRDRERYDYGAVVKLAYEEKEYYVSVSSFREFSFETTESLDLSKLVINEIIPTRSETYGYGTGRVIAIIVIVVLVGFALLVSMGIFSAIFFPIMRRRRRARRNAAKK